MGSFIVLPLATWLSSSNSTAISFYFFLSATCVYTIGVLGVTILGNVPLNEQLANLSIINASKTEVSQMRVLFENTWNKYHTIRTVAAIITFCLTILALIKNKI
ncbi:DUF1772 domain-containing protein [Flavobacterium marginilacus]|uniref:DUF1772 domain-containing protein n=1 Tax=Flavobacterium marginilacus TaxID=3003256 RepID=UPI00248DC36D|nr:DUF1772 domain-containing protein [Flavobacterium marginilacus]